VVGSRGVEEHLAKAAVGLRGAARAGRSRMIRGRGWSRTRPRFLRQAEAKADGACSAGNLREAAPFVKFAAHGGVADEIASCL